MSVKRKLYIIGASYFGREMESWLGLIPENQKDWKLEGFLHSFLGTSPLEKFPSDFKILGDWETFPLTKNDYCIIAVADVDWKEKIYNKLKNKVSFFTYIAPNVTIGKFNIIGEGSIICPNVLLSTNIKLGVCTTLNFGTQIGHDSIIGNFSSIMPQVSISGKVSIGEKVFIGAAATIIPNISIVNNITIGAGSIVIKNIEKSDTTFFGNPARQIPI